MILKSNPVPWHDSDHSFRGICDLCVEALSDSTEQESERDIQVKFNEYARIGVPEYYILYAYGEPQQSVVTALLNWPDFMNIDDMYRGLETHPVSPRTGRVANTATLMIN